MLTLEVELLGPLLVEERLRRAERRYLQATYAQESNLLFRLIEATGSGLVGLGCLLQSLAKRPCLDPSATRIDVVADCGC
jgi:hypothetical protein